MQLLWTIAKCLLKNVENGTEHDVDRTYQVRRKLFYGEKGQVKMLAAIVSRQSKILKLYWLKRLKIV